jgi:hypothetical protein
MALHGRRHQVQFGDFQTPPELADDVCDLLQRGGLRPSSLLEPTCGSGTFLEAALRGFPTIQAAIGVDVNPRRLSEARTVLRDVPGRAQPLLIEADFFSLDWPQLLGGLTDPLLVLGNPPWVTSADVGALRGNNLPRKTNVRGLRGIDAITGKSNFDISEWMLIHLVEALQTRCATLAMLCKLTVARKVLVHAWSSGMSVADARLHMIDAPHHFGAAVDACLLLCSVRPGEKSLECRVYPSLTSTVREVGTLVRPGALSVALWYQA